MHTTLASRTVPFTSENKVSLVNHLVNNAWHVS